MESSLWGPSEKRMNYKKKIAVCIVSNVKDLLYLVINEYHSKYNQMICQESEKNLQMDKILALQSTKELFLLIIEIYLKMDTFSQIFA